MNSIIIKNIILTIIILVTNYSFSQPQTWERVFLNTYQSEFKKVVEASDGEFVALGERRIGNYTKLFIVKMNRFGDTLWTRLYNENLSYYYSGYWIEKTTDKGFIISGYGTETGSHGLLLKVDSSGNYQWHKKFFVSRAQCVKQLQDRGFIVLAMTNGVHVNILLIRTDSSGNTIWTRQFGGTIFSKLGYEIISTDENDFYIAGNITTDISHLYLMKVSSAGDSLWSRTYTEYLQSEAYSIDKDDDGGLIIGGYCDSTTDNLKRSYILKTDSLGNVQWSKKYTTNFNEWCFSVRSIGSSRYVMCGMSDSIANSYERAIIRVLDRYGNILKEKYYRPLSEQNAFYSVEKSTDKGFILCGFADGGSVKAYIVKTDSNLEIKPVGISSNNEFIDDFKLHQNYPNPFNPATVIRYQLAVKSNLKLIIYDALGKEVAVLVNEKKPAGFYEVEFKGESAKGGYPSGVYFYRLVVSPSTSSGQVFVETKRMILLK